MEGRKKKQKGKKERAKEVEKGWMKGRKEE